MDRLANKLGGSVLLAPTFQWLPRMMTSSAWRDRHAALMAISAISEGCRDMMEQELDKILDLVVPALRDSHPRVRWAGCNALGQMSTDFAGTMQEKYHQVVLSNIIPVLESPEPRYLTTLICQSIGLLIGLFGIGFSHTLRQLWSTFARKPRRRFWSRILTICCGVCWPC